jgi:tetratricopeptide (TPR) repeat protein
MFGDYARAQDMGRRAVAVARTTGDPSLESESLHRLGQISLGVGDSATAVDLLRRSVEVLGPLAGTAEPSGFVRGVGPHAWLGYALGYRGEFAEALAQCRHALRLAESANLPGNLLAALGTLGLTLLEQGDVSGAIAGLERGLALCETWAILDWTITLESALGVALALAGRFEEAMAMQRRAEAEEPRAPQGFPAARILRFAETCALAGRVDEARAHAEEGLGLARAGGERGAQVRALRTLGDVLARVDRPDVGASERSFRQALAIADEIGMRPLTARSHLGLGTLYGQIGAARDAAEHLTTALALFTDMAMAHWIAQATRALGEVRARR